MSCRELVMWLAVCGLMAGCGVRARNMIGVADTDPVRAQQLAAAVSAGLAAGAARDAGGEVWAVEVDPAEPGEPLALPRSVCRLAARGAAAVLAGGATPAAAAAAARAGVPLLAVDDHGGAADHTGGNASEVLFMQPHAELLARVGSDLIKEKGWGDVVVLHGGADAAVATLVPLGVAGVARRLPRGPAAAAATRDLMLVLKGAGLRNYAVWGTSDDAVLVLEAGQRAGMLDQRASFLLLSLDMHTRELANYSYAGANITALSLFDTESEAVKEMMLSYEEQYMLRWRVPPPPLSAPGTALVLAYDAALLVYRASREVWAGAGAGGGAGGAGGDELCAGGQGALHAGSLLNYVHAAEEEWLAGAGGAAGAVGGAAEWDARGLRVLAVLGVAELARGGRLQRAGLWKRGRVEWTRPPPPPAPYLQDPSLMENRTFNVIIALNKPYVMRRDSTSRLSGNDRYEGYCVELLQRIAEQLKFNYTLIEQPGNKYGEPDEHNRWDGMLGRLIYDDDIHFAVTDLTITWQRNEVVDFTTPFMNLGITILFHKPQPPTPPFFNFLLPFSTEVWVCLGVAFVATSLLLWLVGRLCPAEWQNPHPCVDEPPALHNQFTVQNAFWFTLGAVLLQGSEIAPVAYGSRAVASMWWLFALVITSSYTANLATLLAKKESLQVIKGVDDLRNNTLGITYGAKAGGSTYNYLKENDRFKDMFEEMQNFKMPLTNEEGIEMATNDKFAFFAESTTIEYTVQRNCELEQVGDLIDRKGYGIALKKRSPYRQAVNLALLNLQERGELREMKDKWWNEKHGGGACMAEPLRENEKLDMLSFVGLFVVLVAGSALGLALSAADLALAVYRRHRNRSADKQDVSYWRTLWAEIRFVFKFDRSVRPLCTPPISPSPSPASESARGSGRGSGRSAGPSLGGGSGRGTPPPTRTPSLRSRRRRSSMHQASLRLARHATREH